MSSEPNRAVSKEPHELEAGEYCQWNGHWVARCPTHDLLANLKQHSVTHHEDGTITVSPSILCSSGKHEYHGYLERGVWRECQ